MSLMNLTATGLGEKIKNKEISAPEAVQAALDAIEAKEAEVNSFVTIDREGAVKRANEVQKLIDEGKLAGPVAGVPVAIKDPRVLCNPVSRCFSSTAHSKLIHICLANNYSTCPFKVKNRFCCI